MHKAQATVATPKAERYLKALCNHFNHKVTAEYADGHGMVQFGFAYCEMNANAEQLVIQVQAEDDSNFDRVKYVVSDHLERFASQEGLQVVWMDTV